VEDVRKMVEHSGIQEIMLLGQNVNSFGKDNGESFADLLMALDEINGLKLMRYTTSHPYDITDELIEVHRTANKLAPHLHLPIQSGSNTVLKRMLRQYSVEHYLWLLEKLRAANPNMVITSDIISGFPNETESEHQDTLKMLDAANFDSIFSYTFSVRRGTKAARMNDVLTPMVRSRRLREIQARQLLIQAKARAALRFFLNDLSAHYLPRAGILGGAHSRDYNRVFSRDLLEEKYFNPLLGGPNRNVHLFHELCLSTLQEIGLSAEQKAWMQRKNRFIVQRWDSLAHTFACDFVGDKFSMGSSNQAYSPDDKPFVIYLSSKRIPEMPNIAFVMEGRNDHYGTWSTEGMGEKMKHLIPANYPSNGGWGKARHLMPFMQSAQNKGEMVMLVSGTKDHNCIHEYLNSTIVLPNTFDEIWLGNQQVTVLDIGAKADFDTTQTLFARFEDVVIAFRFLWTNAEKGMKPALYNDGFKFVASREKFPLQHNAALRITLRHPKDGKADVAMWWKTAEGIKSDRAFADFRQEVLKAEVAVKAENGQPLVKGKQLTGFSDTEEAAVNLTEVVPFLLEAELKKLGAHYSKGADWSTYTQQDGLLITGQNPASSEAAAKELLKILKD
jgi:hypothetical protein